MTVEHPSGPDRPAAVSAPTAALLAALAAANAAAWLWAFGLFGDRPTMLATALLAWVFGLRHAVDADHIAAIDNVVRKLMHQGGHPRAAGLFFSLGHSTVVGLGSMAIAAAVISLTGAAESVKSLGGVIATLVSAAFLFMVAGANLAILRSVWGSFRALAQGGAVDHHALDAVLAGGGMLVRLFRPLFGAVSRSRHMFWLGLLFGLGFDTATEIGLLSISAAEAARGISPAQVLVFPVLFAAGMAFVDTLDSVVMVGVYGWAFVNPVRKLWYNLTITAASVAVAVVIGGIEVLGLIGDKFDLDGGFWRNVAELNRNLADVGFLVVGLFVLTWLGSALIYRLKGYGQLSASLR